jgi:hypothetical protein
MSRTAGSCSMSRQHFRRERLSTSLRTTKGDDLTGEERRGLHDALSTYFAAAGERVSRICLSKAQKSTVC